MEEWLGKVEEAMFTSLRRLCKAAIADYQGKPRTEWVIAGHPSQVRLLLNFSLGAWSGTDSTCMGEWGAVLLQVILSMYEVMYEAHTAHV